MEDESKIDICGYTVTGWQAKVIFVAILAAIFFAGVSVGIQLK